MEESSGDQRSALEGQLAQLVAQASETLIRMEQSLAEAARQRTDAEGLFSRATAISSEAEAALERARGFAAEGAEAATAAKTLTEQLRSTLKAAEATSHESAEKTKMLVSSNQQMFQEKITEVEAKITDVRQRAESASAQANEKYAASFANLESITKSAIERQQAAEAAASTAATQINTIKEIAAQIAQTKAEVQAHHEVTSGAEAAKQKFDSDAEHLRKAFQAKADDLVAAAKKGGDDFAARAAAFDAEIKRLTENAESMLFGATNAGLASGFKDEVKALERKMAWGTFGFLFGIALLTLSLVPLFNYMTRVAAGHEMTFASVLARGLMLGPAGWLCIFFARRVHANFELRQHYVHKYVLAASVEPFRKQAGEHASAAIVGVLGQLMKNPATVLRRHQKMSEGPQDIVVDAATPITETVTKAIGLPQR